jgi:hypothetical protein
VVALALLPQSMALVYFITDWLLAGFAIIFVVHTELGDPCACTGMIIIMWATLKSFQHYTLQALPVPVFQPASSTFGYNGYYVQGQALSIVT